MLGREVVVEVVGSYKEEKFSYTVKYLEVVKEKEVGKRLLEEILMYESNK